MKKKTSAKPATKKKYFRQFIELKKMTARELAMVRACIREALVDTEGGVMTADQPSPSCAPPEQC